MLPNDPEPISERREEVITMTAWVSYARASTEEQTTSCAQQHADNERAARSLPAATFDDEGVPGSVPVAERPGFSRMLDFLCSKEPNTHVIRLYDTSRMGSSPDPEAVLMAERLLRWSGARAVSYTNWARTRKGPMWTLSPDGKELRRDGRFYADVPTPGITIGAAGKRLLTLIVDIDQPMDVLLLAVEEVVTATQAGLRDEAAAMVARPT